VALGAVLGLAMASTVLVACTHDDPAEGGTRAPVTTPANPAWRSAVLGRSRAVVDLPAPPVRGTPQVVANHGEDLVVFGGADRTGSGLDRPHDDGAVLDADTFSWTALPRPPFAHPTASPVGAVVGDELVISGADCDPSRPGGGSSGPSCSVGDVRSARLDLSTRRWERIPSPLGSAVVEVERMWATPGGVLASVLGPDAPQDPNAPPRTAPAVGSAPAGPAAVWSFLPTGADAWLAVAPPPQPSRITCGSQGTVASVSYDVAADGGIGQVRASFFDATTRAWTPPSPPAVEHATGAMGAACVPDGVVWAAVAGPFWGTNGVLQDTTDQAIWVLRRPGTAWERRPWDPTPLDDRPPDTFGYVSLTPFGLPTALPVTLDPAAVVFTAPDRSHAESWDVANGAWTIWPTDATLALGLVDATILGRTVATEYGSAAIRAVA
jgi:hypothetical protein